MENVANNYTTTLSAAITSSGDTTLTVTSATGAPSANFRILVDTELMLVTGVAGTTFTVTRGVEGTTAATHSNGATLTHVLTAASLIQILSERITTGTFASLPAAGASGKLYFPTDVPGIYFDNGSIWTQYGLIPRFKTINNADFSWVNQGSATLTQIGNFWSLYAPGVTSEQPRIRMKTLAASTNYTVTLCIVPITTHLGSSKLGLILRENSSGKLISYHMEGANILSGHVPGAINAQNLNSPGSFNSAIGSFSPVGQLYFANSLWLRIQDNGTNRLFSYSPDGVTFIQTASNSRTTFIVPDQVGFSCQADSSSNPAYMTILSFAEES